MGRRVARMLCSAAILAIVIAGASLVSAAAAPTTVSVDGQQPFTPTGLSVQAGQFIKVTATGRINYCGGSPDPNDNVQPQCDATPDGSVSGESHCGGPTRCGGLIGRIGGGATFAVGADYLAKATSSGALDLGIQDFDEADSPNGVFDNNSGSFTAEVEIDPPARIEGRVVDDDGHGIPDVKVSAKGPDTFNATTDFDGDYEIEVPGKKLGNYTVTPKGESKCSKTCKGGFSPNHTDVDLSEAGTTAEANFTGKCAGGKRSMLRAKGFSPEHGLYTNTPGTRGPLEVYYGCKSQVIRGQWIPQTLDCRDGTRIAAKITSKGLPYASAGKVKLSGRGFDLEATSSRLTFEALDSNGVVGESIGEYLVQVKMQGDFTDESHIRVRVAGAALLESTKCVGGQLTTLHLADEDPAPFE